MKANIMTRYRTKKKINEMIAHQKENVCGKCLENLQMQSVQNSKYSALFHVMHLLVILHDEYGFGKKRLERLLQAYSDADKSFKDDLADGVGWTKTKKRLEEIGLVFDEEESKIAEIIERKYEKNVTYYDGKRREYNYE